MKHKIFYTLKTRNGVPIKNSIMASSYSRATQALKIKYPRHTELKLETADKNNGFTYENMLILRN